jgi:hypothetical protein
VGKYGTVRQPMPFAWWISKATDKLRICNTYTFSTATLVSLPRLIFTFVRTLSVLLVDEVM